MQEETFNLELVCNLNSASNFYDVTIDEVEMKTYHTPFTVSEEDSNATLKISCNGCNELISVYVIDLPRINNFISLKFVFPIILVLGLFFLSFININLSELTIFVLIGIGVFAIISDFYTYYIKPPVELDTHFFWHSIKEKDKS